MTDEELQKYTDNLAKFTESIVNKFRSAATELERNMYIDFLEITSQLKYDANGNLTAENDVATLVQKIDALFVKWASSPNYANSVASLLTDFGEVRKRALDLHEKLNDLKYTPEFYNELNKQQKFLADKTAYDLSQGMLKRYFIEDAKQIILEAAYLGYSQQEVSKRYRDRLVSYGETDSYYMRYATQLTRDSVYTYHGQVNQAIKDEYKMDCIRYIGSVVEDTRSFCKHVINNMKRLIKVSELPKLLKQYENSKGMKENTDANNFLAVRGGWNCRHTAFPVRCKQ